MKCAPSVGKTVELRYAPGDNAALPRVFVDQEFYCDTVPLDRLANMYRLRRRIAGDADPRVTGTGLDALGLIEEEHYRRTRPVAASPDALADDDDETEPDDDLF